MIGLAGTVTTVAAVELGLADYDRDVIHHLLLSRAAAEDVFRTLATESRAAPGAQPRLEPARVPTSSSAAAACSSSLLRRFGADEMPRLGVRHPRRPGARAWPIGCPRDRACRSARSWARARATPTRRRRRRWAARCSVTSTRSSCRSSTRSCDRLRTVFGTGNAAHPADQRHRLGRHGGGVRQHRRPGRRRRDRRQRPVRRAHGRGRRRAAAPRWCAVDHRGAGRSTPTGSWPPTRHRRSSPRSTPRRRTGVRTDVEALGRGQGRRPAARSTA